MTEKTHDPEKERIFKPRRRRLLDALLFLNSIALIVLAFKPFPVSLLAAFCILINCASILLWFYFLTPLMTIRIAGNTVTGRDGKFRKQSIPFRKINFTDTIVSPEGTKRIFFKDIYSTEGKRIRIHRLFLGEGQVNTIITTLERYPFREGRG